MGSVDVGMDSVLTGHYGVTGLMTVEMAQMSSHVVSIYTLKIIDLSVAVFNLFVSASNKVIYIVQLQ